MPDQKPVVTPAAALQALHDAEATLEAAITAEIDTAAPAAPADPAEAKARLTAALAAATPKVYRFGCLQGPGREITFPDGSKFTFRLIPLNTGGYAPNSFVDTADEVLAANLRALKNPYIVEQTA